MLNRFEKACYVLVVKFPDINLYSDFEASLKSPIRQFIPYVNKYQFLELITYILYCYIRFYSLFIVYIKYIDRAFI